MAIQGINEFKKTSKILNFIKVPLSAVPGWNSEGENYNGCDFCIMMKIAKDNGEDWIMGGVTFPQPESETKKPTVGNRHADGMDLDSPSWFLDHFRARLGHLRQGELLRVMEIAARLGKITPNPQYEFCAWGGVVRGALVLVGDAAHMGTPRTGAGAHTAVLDATALLHTFEPLLRQIDKTTDFSKIVAQGLKLYEPGALERAQALYQRSLALSKDVLPEGWTREDAVIPMTVERAKALSVKQLKNELYVRRVNLTDQMKEKDDLVRALLIATKLAQE